ncbi:DUF2528 family protein [Pseudomonas gessardii]|uniref:DUF2528 family protein n=1 Tax=Pseudomonas gessardii TaxID=78544 RepID=A0ABS9FBD0_9PSED|nr:DUF2528 family protein [Pseudomonas gessardii]MCF4980766.1 DUF2528 family protein [Pseudomonas gessardii]MCF4988485.1 DUF2528 family protein [Pseudomonas gessardii]MCF5098258.1 DUF2528 family protein [Pseudomonas gessardii]MCF5098269.1 DUF2528 family protein [Pseudomonas gessardii]MCF5109665.1 DUF2528 family protein [Pseudomonas gessardii]
MNAPSQIKRYKIEQTWGGNHSVTLEVDHETLTTERALEHLRFWTGADDKISEEDGDAVRAAIRDFGVNAIYHMLADFGADFKDEATAKRWSEKMRDMEGYGGETATPYGWLGIRIIAAEAQSPSFEEVELKEVAQA